MTKDIVNVFLDPNMQDRLKRKDENEKLTSSDPNSRFYYLELKFNFMFISLFTLYFLKNNYDNFCLFLRLSECFLNGLESSSTVCKKVLKKNNQLLSLREHLTFYDHICQSIATTLQIYVHQDVSRKVSKAYFQNIRLKQRQNLMKVVLSLYSCDQNFFNLFSI